MKLRAVSMLMIVLAVSSCRASDHQITLKEIDTTTATFDVVNRSKLDAMAMNFELTYLAANDSILLVDTVEFTAKQRDGSPDVFLKAGDSTFFAQRVPEGTTTATAKVLGHR